MQITGRIVVYLPDSRDVELSRFGRGNAKIGAHVYTYSRLPTRDGTCPGATSECERICYAKRVEGVVREIWVRNSKHELPPQEIPGSCHLLRLHIAGDFTSRPYIEAWQHRLMARPDVQCWSYTRSWRVTALRPALEALRALSNVQLFASVDPSTTEPPPEGWRVAWIDGDPRQRGYVCPEETGRKADCEACGYCFRGTRGDVVFLRH